MTDELDLVGALGSAEPLRPEAYQRARAVLRAAMADPGTVRLLGAISAEDTTMEATSTMETTTTTRDHESSPAIQRRRRIGIAGRLGIGAGVGVAAAAAVVAVVLNSPATGGIEAGKDSPAATSGSTTVDGSAERAPLMTLAGSIKTVTPSAGDAWLVKATQVHGTKTMQVVYTLYTDGHAIYTGNSVKDIKRAIARHQDQMTDGGYAPLLKAAVAAADSSPADGRTQMLKAAKDPLVGLDPAAQKAVWDKQQASAQVIIKQKGGNAKPKPYSPQAVQRHFDNALWTYSTQALSAGDGNTQVRAGVLRLLSTISAVSVKNSTTHGKATLTITAGPEAFGGEGSEVLTIDATTGMLVKDISTVPGLPQASTTYESSRVTKADL
jgi:negative regulator of sigma E activity